MEFRGSQAQPSGRTNSSEPARTNTSSPASSNTINPGGGSRPVKTMQMQQTSTGNNNSKIVMLLVAVVAVIVLAGGALLLSKSMGGGSSVGGEIKKDKYQAVFLTNGQVYFGKVSNIDSQYVTLSDIYYLQVQQTVQPDQQQADPNKQPQVSLAKLGSELHGPEDAMYISRDQVLFWENLTDAGKVTEAIKADKNK